MPNVYESITLKVIQCPGCFKIYTPSPGNKLIKCSYCHKKFKVKPKQFTQEKTIHKLKCPNCNHSFKPRMQRDHPVCPKCHQVI